MASNTAALRQSWTGDYAFLLGNLMLKDFRVRYRNMSLGVAWSLLNPLVMMAVLSFVFTVLWQSSIKDYPVHVLCGLIPFNFFSLTWSIATSSILDNSNLVKRVAFPRELIPLSTVLSSCLHFAIQTCLLIALTLGFGYRVHLSWLYLPLVLALEVVFVSGLALATSALNVVVWDVRYVVESLNTVLFWLVPIVYSFPDAAPYAEFFKLNPMAAVIMACRNILMDGRPPHPSLLIKLAIGSVTTFLVGLAIFRRLKRKFYNYV